MILRLALMLTLVADLGGETVTSLHLTPTGELLVSENTGRPTIRMVTPDGQVHLLVDELRSAASVAGTRDTFAVADPVDGRVNLFHPSGTTVLRADTVRDLAPGYWAATPDTVGRLHPSGEWEPRHATAATGVSEHPGGVLYTTVSPCHVYADGRVVAGTGECGPHALDFPQDVELTPDGGLVLAERSRVSRIAPDGAHSVLHAGSADGLEVTPDGDVLFSTGARIYRYDGNFVPRETVLPPVVSPVPPTPVPPPPVTPAPTVAKSASTFARRSYTVRRGKRLRVTFTASHAGRYRLDVRRHGRRVKRLSGSARAGRNAVAFKVTLEPGRYTLKLADGTRVATLRVRR